MNKLLTILAAVALVAIGLPASAETVLPDEVLGGLYAGDIAIAAQTNTATLVAATAGIVNAGIVQHSKATLKRDVEDWSTATGIGKQSNVAGLWAGGDINGLTIDQWNRAEDRFWVDVNALGSSTAIAIKAQSNIAAGVTENGNLHAGNDMKNVDIDQENKADVKGDVDAPTYSENGGTAKAIESQTNLVALEAGNDMKNVDILQWNKAKVHSGADVTGRNTTAIGAQCNTAALYSAAGTITDATISQHNLATVSCGADL